MLVTYIAYEGFIAQFLSEKSVHYSQQCACLLLSRKNTRALRRNGFVVRTQEHKEWIRFFGRLPPFPTIRFLFGRTGDFTNGWQSWRYVCHLAMDLHQIRNFLQLLASKDLTLIGNDDSNWDEVEDFDALSPWSCAWIYTCFGDW